ncbi:hypothetical protein ACWGCW_05310 [Streptomyces sp. NPDC054933]
MARRRTDLVKADAQYPAPSGTRTDLPVVPGPGEPVGYDAQLPVMDEELTAHPEEVLAEAPDARDISAELSAPPRRKLPWLTLLLCTGVVAGLAFAGGALVEKNQLQGSPGAGGSAFAAGRGGAGSGSAAGRGGSGRSFGGGQGGGQAGGGTGAASGSGMTVGTVKLVDGSTIYVTDAQGNTVKITTAQSTQVSEAKSGKVSDLQPGQTVVVRGNQDSSGDIAATTVTEGGLGTGGGGGRGFGGGGAGGTGG